MSRRNGAMAMTTATSVCELHQRVDYMAMLEDELDVSIER